MTLANEKLIVAADARSTHPKIRKISPADLKDALVKGLDDFKTKPSHLFILPVIYPLVIVISATLVAGYEILPIVFPLVSGFALVGPLVAIGLYELSRRREEGLDMSWEHAFTVIRSPSIGAIVKLSALLGVIYFAWLGAALAIYLSIFGSTIPTSIGEFVPSKFSPPLPDGHLLIVGCSVGFIFALMVLAISAVSFPAAFLTGTLGTVTAIQTVSSRISDQPNDDVDMGLYRRQPPVHRLLAIFLLVSPS